jgi:hypothetical protein
MDGVESISQSERGRRPWSDYDSKVKQLKIEYRDLAIASAANHHAASLVTGRQIPSRSIL